MQRVRDVEEQEARARDDQRKIRANQQIEAQKLYKQELQASYKNVLNDQMMQKQQLGDMALAEKQVQATESKHRQLLNRERDEANRQQRVQQQFEYRHLLDD